MVLCVPSGFLLVVGDRLLALQVTSDQLWWAPDVQDGVGYFALTLKSAALSACAMCECATLSAG